MSLRARPSPGSYFRFIEHKETMHGYILNQLYFETCFVLFTLVKRLLTSAYKECNYNYISTKLQSYAIHQLLLCGITLFSVTISDLLRV